MIRFTSGTLYHWNLEHRGTSISFDAQGPMTLDNTNLMVEAALAGIGIAWVPEYHVVDHLVAGRLVHLLPEWSPSFPGLVLQPAPLIQQESTARLLAGPDGRAQR